MNQYQFFATKKVSPIAKTISRLLHKKLFALFQKHFHETGKHILEIGPGQGDFTKLLTTIPDVVYKGYEPESLLCNKLQKLGLSVTQTIVPPIPEQDSMFGAVVLLNVLEHMKGLPAAQHLAAELHRVLSPGGIAFISFPSYLDWKTDFFNLDYTHNFITTEVNVSQLLVDAGFSIENIRYSYGCFISDFGRLFNALAKTARWILSTLLPRKISRKEKVQKLGILFAENIVLIARKKNQ